MLFSFRQEQRPECAIVFALCAAGCHIQGFRVDLYLFFTIICHTHRILFIMAMFTHCLSSEFLTTKIANAVPLCVFMASVWQQLSATHKDRETVNF